MVYNVSRCTSFLSSRTQKVLRHFFYWLGKHIDSRPWLFILIGIMMTLICSFGFYFFKSENRSLYLWIPRDSIEWSQYIYIIDTFGSYPAPMSILVTINDEISDSILSPSNMDTCYDIFNVIDNITLIYDTTYDFQYDDVCLRPYPMSPYCLSTYNNIFGLFFKSYLYDDQLWQNDSNIKQIINVNNSAIGAFAGGLERDENNQNYIISADVLLITYRVEGSLNKTKREISYEYMGAFQDYWALHSNDYDDVTVLYYTDRTFDDELGRVVNGDIPIFGLAIITMTVYLMLTLGKLSCIAARAWLACSAVLVMICSLLMGYGISMFLGTEFNTLCALVPYILLGVGVDDMIILVDTFDETPIEIDTTNSYKRLSKALSSSGLSISLTSYCSSMAFFVGSATDIPSISSFCVFSGWCFLANYILQFLIFVPLMVYDDRRMQKKNNFCCPCICKHGDNLNNNDNNDNNDNNKKLDNDDKVNKCTMKYLIQICVIPLLSKRIYRCIIIIIFLIIFSLSCYVTSYLSTETDVRKFVPDDSYFLHFVDKLDENFGQQTIDEVQIIIKNQDFSNKTIRDNVYSLIAEIENEDKCIGQIEHWLDAFKVWIYDNKNGTILDNIIDKEIYYKYLKQFTNDSLFTRWDSEIIYNDNDNNMMIEATRFYMNAFKETTVNQQYPQYQKWNEIFLKYIDYGFIFTPTYCYAYLTYTIFNLTVENMLFAAIGVFSILFILLDIRMAIFIIIIVLMIDIDLFAWMWLLDVSLDSVSYSQCVMAVGLTVDYVIHLTHTITDIPTNTNIPYSKRLNIAMTKMGISVCKGAFTTLLGALALIFSQSQAFRIFLKMFTGIIIIAVTHGILLTPSLLGELTFIYNGIHHNQHIKSTQMNNSIQMSTNNNNDNNNNNENNA